MAGSAIFVLNTKNIEDFAKIKSFELVATDTLGNESARQLPMKSQWIENAKVLLVEDRPFAVDEKGKLTYKD
jgi:hypothetical protein